MGLENNDSNYISQTLKQSNKVTEEKACPEFAYKSKGSYIPLVIFSFLSISAGVVYALYRPAPIKELTPEEVQLQAGPYLLLEKIRQCEKEHAIVMGKKSMEAAQEAVAKFGPLLGADPALMNNLIMVLTLGDNLNLPVNKKIFDECNNVTDLAQNYPMLIPGYKENYAKKTKKLVATYNSVLENARLNIDT